MLKRFKNKKAWVVHGQDGLDEITTTTKTDVIEVNNNKIKRFTIDPAKLKLRKSKLSYLKGKDSSYNAKQISDLFSGNLKNIYYKEIILLNTAAILVLTNKCKNLKQGIEIAEKNIINGMPKEIKFIKKVNQLMQGILRKFMIIKLI